MKDPAKHLFSSLNPEELVSPRGYYPIPEGQIIFHYKEWDCYVITTIDEEKDYTTDHYNLLPELAPYQLINGKLVFMAAPSTQHQRISRRLTRQIDNFVEDNQLGEMFYAPYDVEFDKENVVQPDLIFISIKRSSIVGEKRAYGTPDFIVEILSTNEDDDRIRKMQLYAENDVLEYWIVAPEEEYIEVYHNENQQMQLVQKANKGDSIRSKAIEGFVLDLANIFVG